MALGGALVTFKEWLATLPAEQRDDAEERAAIREYDGEMRRDRAERLTMQEWGR